MRLNNRRKMISLKPYQGLFALVGIFVIALFYIYQHIYVVQMGYVIEKKEDQFKQLINEKNRLEMIVARLESPKNLEKLLAMQKLNLARDFRVKIRKVKL